ncbi:hypothetical protein [Neomegalonema sp.]|uniref:hypothetical protein n=1 Tax=Neomegalonema sp. TaxID=2039713 RepID=UPI00261EFC79|nr:hypothetical protein [Neomegalonema sp.]MDD2869311.1 hypothetical protein [Neomegalonema sp.]
MSARLSPPEKYSRTLVVMGRFRADRPEDAGKKGVFVFETGDSSADGALSAADVFSKLKPELRLLDDSSVWVDDVGFYALRMKAPGTAAEEGSAMEVSPNSVLLDQARGAGGATDASRAAFGGLLAQDMIRDLDVTARFSGSTFPKALLELAHRYLNVDVNRLLGTSLIGAGIDDLFRDDPIVTGRILQLLLAFEADAPAARKALRAALEAFGLEGRDAAERSRKIDAIAASVESLRGQLEGDPRNKSWDQIVGVAPQLNLPWVEDLSKGDPAYRVDLGDVGIPVGGSLRDAYVLYRKSADNLHKFVRAPSLHSYVFLWLMSKYAEMQEGKPGVVAKAVHRRGVEGAGRKRVFGETPEDAKRRKGIAERAASERIEQLSDSLKVFAPSLLTDIRDVVAIDNRFTRADLNDRLAQLFVTLSSSVSGPIAEALSKARTVIGSYGAVYQKLVDALNSGEARFWTADAMAARIDGIGDSRHRETLAAAVEALRAAFAETPAQEAAAAEESPEAAQRREDARRRRIRGATLDAFAAAFGDASIRGLAENLEEGRKDGEETESQKQIREMRALYRAGGLISEHMGEVAEAAAAASVPPAAAVAEGKITKKGEESLRRAAESAAANPPPTRFLMPAEITERIPPGKEFVADLHNDAGEVIGRLTGSRSEGAEILFREDAPGLDGEDPLKDVKLVFREGDVSPADPLKDEPILLKEIDPDGRVISALEERKIRAESGLSAAEIGERLARYGEMREALRRIYTGSGQGALSGGARAEFERGMRALTLGEFIAAAPDGQSRLGRPTISESLKLLMDVVQVIGARAHENPDLAKPRPDQGSAEALGPLKDGDPEAALNLSTYFRLPSGPDSALDGERMITQVMAYHRYLTDSVQNVSTYLQDLADLKGIADAASGARLVVINRTLDEYVAEAVLGGEVLTHGLHAATLYLTHAARAAGSGWGQFGDFFAYNYTKKQQASGLSCPMVISAEADVLEACPFPVAALGGLRALKFRIQAAGGAAADLGKGLLMEGAEAALSSPAAMAAATVVQNAGALGRLSSGSVPFSFRREFEEVTRGVVYKEGEAVVSLLRRLWLNPDSNDCLAAMVTSRCATLTMTRDLNDKTLNSFVRLLIAARLEQGKDAREILEQKDLDAAHRALFDSAIFPPADRPNVQILESTGRINIVSHNFVQPIFSGSSAFWLELRRGAGQEPVRTPIKAALLAPLSFLGL